MNNLTQRGFSMIEVLITLVIVALALLGSAGLQAYAMKTGLGGQYRNQAVFLLEDIVERMEANQTYASAAGTAYDTTLNSGASTDCVANNCTPAQLAAYDVTQWEKDIAAALPTGASGTVAIVGASGVPATYQITINWTEHGTAKPGSNTLTVSEPFSVQTTRTIGN